MRFRRPLCAALVLLCVSVSHGQATTLQFNPSSLTLAAGEMALVQVDVSDIPSPGLAAFQFDARFDPLVVSLFNPNEAFRAAGILAFSPLGGNPFCGIIRGTGATCPDPVWFLTSTGRTAVG